jgi:mono/diheme cytochrome c family protein
MDRWRLLALFAAALLALLFTWSLAGAQAHSAFGAGEPATGAAMHEKDCVACHVRRLGGDGSAMYTRAERRVRTPEQLKAQIAVCNTELGTAYFPDEEDHLAAYLNQRYYRFKE